MSTDIKDTIIFDITTYQDCDKKWHAVILDPSKEVILGSRASNGEQQAILNVRRKFWSAIKCSHEFEYGDYCQIGQDSMGNDIYGHEGQCKKCGMYNSFEVSNRDD